jgi:hypothetical protein
MNSTGGPIAPGDRVTIHGRGPVYEVDRIDGPTAWLSAIAAGSDAGGFCEVRFLEHVIPAPPASGPAWPRCPDAPPADW